MSNLSDYDEDKKPNSIADTIKRIALTGRPFNSTHIREARPDANGHAVASAFSALSQGSKKRGALIMRAQGMDPELSKGPNSHGSRPVDWWVATPELYQEANG